MDEVKSGLTFEQAKGMADRAIRDVKNGIVSAGYALKAIRSERLWEEQGFTSFDDFMERCYQKDKSWASNCIRVYEQFGELAGPEQMPRLQAKYQEYSAGGLIEMLSMPEELREQVTADMPVREIRELKREARKVATSQPEEEEQLEGQMDITDFPEFMPEPEENNVINIMDLVDEPDGVDCLDEEPAAGRQPERDLDSASSCPPGISSCIRQNWGTSKKDQEEGRKECAACWKHWKALNESIQTELVQGQQENIEAEPEERHWPKVCIMGWSKYGNCVCCGSGGVKCCVSCEEPCNSRCGWIPEPAEGQEGRQIKVPEINILPESLPEKSDLEEEKGESGEEEEREASEGQQEEPEATQRKISVEGLLEKYERELAEMQEAFQDTPKAQWPLAIEKTRILAAALRLLAEQERKQQEEPESLGQAQPELPLMKNNDQRKEWLRNYQAWGLWYEDERIGVRYYKYDFENGACLIAEEYPAVGKMNFTASYLHLVGGPEPPKHPSYGIPRWSRHERYDKHPDSETELVEFLKAVQR